MGLVPPLSVPEPWQIAMTYRSTLKIAFAALAALLTGIVIYLVDRGADAYFLSGLQGISSQLPPLFGQLGQQLPSALHVYAFILLTVICLPRGPGYLLTACLGWLAIEWLFEFAQHPLLQQPVTALVPEWFDGIPLLEAGRGYFIGGRFDPLDLAAAVVGAGAAWLTVAFFRGRYHETT